MNDVILPLTMCTRIEKRPDSILYIPEIIGHWDPYIQRKMNNRMREMIDKLAKQQYKEQDVSEFSEMIATYEVKTNERNVLSIAFQNYAYAAQHAHGLTLMDSLTFDVLTGKDYALSELFLPGSNYIDILTQNVNKQIKEREMPVLVEGQVDVAANQVYYISDQVLVLYYPLYAITPYYYGFPLFPISVYELGSVIREDSPLGRMIS